MSVNSAIQGLVERGLRSVDHVAVLLCLRDSTQPLTADEIATSTKVSVSGAVECLRDLVAGGLVGHEEKTSRFGYAVSVDDRVAVDAIALLHTQWPETLTKVFASDRSRSIKSFSTAFRLRSDKDER